jgi:hypothetical protein
MVDIHEGAVNGGKIFMLDALKTYTIGNDPLTFRATIFSYQTLPGKVLIHDRAGNFATRTEEGGYLNAIDLGDPSDTVTYPTPADWQAALTAYALQDIGITDPLQIFPNTKVKNTFNNHIWILTNTPHTDPAVFDWADDGEDTISPASNTAQGTVRGNPEDPEGVSIEGGIIRVVVGGNTVPLAEMVDGYGRNLMTVLGKTTIVDTIAEIKRLCNNSAQIDNTGIPRFDALRVGDYIDGMDLSAIAAEDTGPAGQSWSDTYKNNRIEIAGFNTYKGVGDVENTLNHVLFTFRHIPIRKRMNATDDNTGGYQATNLRAFLEGLNGDGTGDKSGITTARFLTVLRQQLGDQLYTIKKCHSKKGTHQWDKYTCFVPTEPEVFGNQTWGDELKQYNTNVQWPIFLTSSGFRSKRNNGAREGWWEHTPSAGGATSFCHVNGVGSAGYHYASGVGGVSPAFCVA